MTLDCTKEDKVISEFLHALGPWRNLIVIGGGYALIIYRLYFAEQKLETFPVGTHDIDSLISRKVLPISKKDIAVHLQEAGFKRFFKDYDQPATEAYVKEIEGAEIEIEFLTDASTRKDKHKNVTVAGIVAQPLSYLTLSLETTVKFTTYSSETGWVVSPGAWIFHKGLTFIRRNSPLKTHKDLYGIWYLATQLEECSETAIAEFSILGLRHPKWLRTLKDNIQNWLENAAPIDWARLESQDPYGKLKRLNFERTMMKLIK